MRYHDQHGDDFEEDSFFEDQGDDGMGRELEAELFYQDQEDRSLRMAELTLKEANLNRRILSTATKTLEKSFFWKFLRHETKLKRIEETYRRFSKLISEE